MSKIVTYGFYLIVLLIVVVYFTGTTSVTNSLTTGINKILLTLQGRNQDGTFQDYPN
jgi:hypothetical protein